MKPHFAFNRYLSPLIEGLAVILASFYLWTFLDGGWVPHDEGYLAHSAERILMGQWPHVDFDEFYTGGLTLLHSIMFKALGIKLISLRYMLFGWSIVFLIIMQKLFKSFLSPLNAALLMLAVLVWSVPNYFASMPSWYNLFLAVFTVYSLFFYNRYRQKRYIFIAGILTGVSLTIKITGLYLMASCLVFALYDEASMIDRNLNFKKNPFKWSSPSFVFWLKIILLVSLGYFLWIMTESQASVMTFLHFIWPSLALILFIVIDELNLVPIPFLVRTQRLGLWLFNYFLGLFLPLVVFFVPTLINQKGQFFLQHLIKAPGHLLQNASYPLPDLLSLITVLPFIILMILQKVLDKRFDKILAGGVLSICALVLYFSQSSALVYQTVGVSLRPLIPLMVTLCIVDLWYFERSLNQRRTLFLFASVLAFSSLIQFPLSYPIYIMFVAPLLGLTYVYWAKLNLNQFIWTQRVVAGFVLVFGAIYLNQCNMTEFLLGFNLKPPFAKLELDRAGIKVPEFQKQIYEQVCRLLDQHAPNQKIYVAEGGAEIYFLCQKTNITRTLVLDFDPNPDLGAFVESLIKNQINVVVIDRAPMAPQVPPSEQKVAQLLRHFTHTQEVGPFIVAWAQD